MIRFNQNVVSEIIQGDARGKTALELKDLYVRRNIFDVDQDSPVYRITGVNHVLDDARHAVLTHAKIDKKVWGDTAENPLLNRTYIDVVTGGELTLNGLVESMYGSCWSLSPLDTMSDWAVFTRRKPGVRLQSTPRKLLTSLMRADNQEFMLQHAVGKMKYLPEQEIEAYFRSPDWDKHLDSLGQGIAASLLLLSGDLCDEDEVRVLYNHLNNPWPQANVKLVHRLAKVPFLWELAIDAVVVGPFVQEDGGEATIRQELADLGVTCPVSSSLSRTAKG